MTESMNVGWKLEPEDRDRLLLRFPPAFSDLDADHVTLGKREALPKEVDAKVVGYASDGTGLECLAIAIDGETDRPDGSVFHITWSLDKQAGRRAIQSNDLLQSQGFIELDHPIAIHLWPSVLE